MPEITNERLLKEIQGNNERMGEMMQQIHRIEGHIRNNQAFNPRNNDAPPPAAPNLINTLTDTV